MIEKLYNRITSTDSDMAVCSMQYVDINKNPLYSENRQKFKFEDVVWSKDEFYRCYCGIGSVSCVVSMNKLYKKDIFTSLRYPVGKVREDEFIFHSIVEQCERICCISQRLYYYRQRENSIMANVDLKNRLDFILACKNRTLYFTNTTNTYMLENSILRWISSVENYHLYENKDYKTFNKEIKKCIRSIDFHSISLKTKCILYLYLYNLFPYKFIHSILVMIRK